MASKLFKFASLLGLAWILLQCSATNPAVQKFYTEAVELQRQKEKLQEEYFTTLGHLQKFPNERTLRLKQGDLKKELVALKVKIEENRKQLDLSVKQWEDAVAEKRTEELLIQREERSQGTPNRRSRRRNVDPTEGFQ